MRKCRRIIKEGIEAIELGKINLAAHLRFKLQMGERFQFNIQRFTKIDFFLV